MELGGYAGLAEPSVRRVGFGRGYVADSVVELFEENLEHFPVLLPMLQQDDPGRYPNLRLHNGSIWRRVRPLIGFDGRGAPHVRLEQRVMPSDPSMPDMVANAALYYGLVHALARDAETFETGLPFAAACTNFYAAARHGLAAELSWLDGTRYPARALLLEVILPLARRGLGDFGLDKAEIEHYLGIVEARVHSGLTGAAWQLARLAEVGGDIHRMMGDYLKSQRGGAPVHEWAADATRFHSRGPARTPGAARRGSAGTDADPPAGAAHAAVIRLGIAARQRGHRLAGGAGRYAKIRWHRAPACTVALHRKRRGGSCRVAPP